MSTKTQTNATANETQTPTNPSWVTQPLQNLTSQITALNNVPASTYVAPQGALQQQANTQGASTLGTVNPNYGTASGLFSGNSSANLSPATSLLNAGSSADLGAAN